jgi:hypothetical protein
MRGYRILEQDFLGKYGEGATPEMKYALDQHAKLIDLLLGSKDLHEGNKEVATEAVHVVADQLTTLNGNRFVVNGTLEAVSAVARTADDISGQANDAIQQLHSLLGAH